MFAAYIEPEYNPAEVNLWASPDPEYPSIFTTANVSDTSRAGYVQTGISTGQIAPTSSGNQSSDTPGIFGGLKNWLSGVPLSLAWKSKDEIVQKAKTDAEKSSIFGSIGDWFSGTLTQIVIILVLLFVGFLFVKKQMGV